MENNVEIVRTTSKNSDFAPLVALLDQSLWASYPDLKQDYWGNNIIELNPNVVIVYKDKLAIACACFKKNDKNSVEIKRMFVSEDQRGKGLAQIMLKELELWAKDSGFSSAILETLYKQKAAIAMYQKLGYAVTDNYEPYVHVKQSICMRKRL